MCRNNFSSNPGMNQSNKSKNPSKSPPHTPSILHAPHGEAVLRAYFAAAQGAVVKAEGAGEGFAVAGGRACPETGELAEHEKLAVGVAPRAGGQGLEAAALLAVGGGIAPFAGSFQCAPPPFSSPPTASASSCHSLSVATCHPSGARPLASLTACQL